MRLIERFRGTLLGLAAGDAVGTTAEFRPRGTFDPVIDMVGGGPFTLCRGEWTDDTSMALCLATSLIERKGFDAADQMGRYCNWYLNGYLSSTGHCFDIGGTVREALTRFLHTGEPFSGARDPQTAGNGSLMRLGPVALFYFNHPDQLADRCAESSRTTHAAPECLDACRLFGRMLWRALRGEDKAAVLFQDDLTGLQAPRILEIGRGTYRAKSVDLIEGSGYVVKSLEAALWCFWRTDSFEAAILEAANLGDDADTTAAVCGQLAGAYYGETGIPRRWRDQLAMRETISDLAEQLLNAATQGARDFLDPK